MDIVTCSRKEGDAQQMFETFNASKPCKLFEMVGYASIAYGYNEGLRRSLMDSNDGIVAFTHSDVRNMGSQYAWQRAISFLVEKMHVGFVGVAGTAFLPDNGIWWSGGAGRGSITHENKGNVYKSIFGQGLTECPVVALDGVFLMASKAVLKDFQFWSFGFHFYDIDACMQMLDQGRSNYVVDIPLLHYSIGELDKSWYAANNEFITKWQNKLPVSVRKERT